MKQVNYIMASGVHQSHDVTVTYQSREDVYIGYSRNETKNILYDYNHSSQSVYTTK